MCKVCSGYHGTSEIEHGLSACTVDNPLTKVCGLSLCTGTQTMLFLSHYQVNMVFEAVLINDLCIGCDGDLGKI